ncbi:MAG TPA: V-type ATPase 116kDa subunit family protein, partial [Gemmatimonadales bacterium]|nr:V-type ATPase 116kDa subunit family protein [Gemmatimonadales bacterium]
LHLADPPALPTEPPADLPAAAARRERQLARMLQDLETARTALRTSEHPKAAIERPPVGRLARWARDARRVRRAAVHLADRRAALEEERALVARYQRFFGAFASLEAARHRLAAVSAYHVVLRAEQAGHLERLRAALREALGDAFEILSETLPGGETAVLLLVPAESARRIDALLVRARVQEVPMPAGYGGTLAEAIPRLLQRYVDIPIELAETDAERATLADRHGTWLAEAEMAVHDELQRRHALTRTAATTHAFVIEGWVPVGSERRLEDALDRRFQGTVVMETIGREHWRAEDAPVVLHNPRLFRPFETITRMLPLPHYGTIDPTPFVGVFFPMFFGLMLGDIGYGLAMGLLAGILHWRSKVGTTLRAVSEVMGACAMFSVAFGIAFGELLGDLGHRMFGLEPLLFNREHQVMAFLGLAVAIGVVHIVLGLALGAFANRRSHPRSAIGKGLSAVLVLLIAGAILAALGALPRALMTPLVIGMLVAFPVIVILEGIVAPIELFSTLGHILSYARIMALGTASVMLAVVANEMVGAMGSVLIGVVFALLFHLVNFGLGLFSPAIHSLRLHYVEFFGTFYSP